MIFEDKYGKVDGNNAASNTRKLASMPHVLHRNTVSAADMVHQGHTGARASMIGGGHGPPRQSTFQIQRTNSNQQNHGADIGGRSSSTNGVGSSVTVAIPKQCSRGQN